MSELVAHVAGMFGGASGVFKTLKEGADAIREAKNLELYERMLAVYGDVMELVEKNRELADENRSLKEQLTVKANLVFDGEKYWLERDGKKEGPFCSICHDIDSKLVRMRAYRDVRGTLGHTCDFCGRHRNREYEKSRSGD
jgi:hypothetical protein